MKPLYSPSPLPLNKLHQWSALTGKDAAKDDYPKPSSDHPSLRANLLSKARTVPRAPKIGYHVAAPYLTSKELL